MLVWLRQSGKVRKSNKKFENNHFIKAIGSHEFNTLQLRWAIEGSIPFQIKQTASKLGYYFRNYDKFAGKRWFEELQNRKPVSQISACIAISRKRQATGFEHQASQFTKTQNWFRSPLTGYISDLRKADVLAGLGIQGTVGVSQAVRDVGYDVEGIWFEGFVCALVSHAVAKQVAQMNRDAVVVRSIGRQHGFGGWMVTMMCKLQWQEVPRCINCQEGKWTKANVQRSKHHSMEFSIYCYQMNNYSYAHGNILQKRVANGNPKGMLVLLSILKKQVAKGNPEGMLVSLN